MCRRRPAKSNRAQHHGKNNTPLQNVAGLNEEKSFCRLPNGSTRRQRTESENANSDYALVSHRSWELAAHVAKRTSTLSGENQLTVKM
jgi:hypothetical protein